MTAVLEPTQASPEVTLGSRALQLPVLILAGLLWSLGWAVGKAYALLLWIALAVKLGWLDARG